MVQTEQSAKFDGMPRAARIHRFRGFHSVTGGDARSDHILCEAPLRRQKRRVSSIIKDESGLAQIFSMLRERFKVDFTHYKPSTGHPPYRAAHDGQPDYRHQRLRRFCQKHAV